MYNIITVPSKNIRAIAREALAGKWKLAILGSIIYYCAITLPTLVLNLFPGLSGAFGVSLYTLLVTGAFTYGFSLFCMTLFRKGSIDYTTIFSGFEIFIKTLVLFIVQSLFIFLWTLLFIIPGIIAAFKYSQSFFILIDHPEYSPMQCISESKRIMTGNKEKLFCLNLSFIGWGILASIPTGICSTIITTRSILYTGEVSFGAQLLSYIAELPLAVVTVYMMIATVVLYEMIVGNLVPRIDAGVYNANSNGGATQVNMGQNEYRNPSPYTMKDQETASARNEDEAASARNEEPVATASATDSVFVPADKDEGNN